MAEGLTAEGLNTDLLLACIAGAIAGTVVATNSLSEESDTEV